MRRGFLFNFPILRRARTGVRRILPCMWSKDREACEANRKSVARAALGAYGLLGFPT